MSQWLSHIKCNVITLCLMACIVFSNSVLANVEAINWLQSLEAVDGSYTLASDIANPVQSTSETISSLLKSNAAISQTSFDFISSNPYVGCEYLSRKIIAGVQSGVDVTGLVNQLVMYQNDDGGFGELVAYQSSSIDTAFALIALADAGYDNDSRLSVAVGYILQSQQADGRFPLSSQNQSSIYETAIISVALQKYLSIYNVSSAINDANQFLLNQKNTNNSWDTDWETSIALLAIVPTTSDITKYADAYLSLSANQLPSGSWGDDVFTTALALQAVTIASNVSVSPDQTTGQFTGFIVDQATGLAIQGVTVSLIEDATNIAITGTDGSFLLSGLTPGVYTLTYQYFGYANASQQESVAAGQLRNLGVINLDTDQTTGIITGTVTDAISGAALSGATINISGSTTSVLTTDVDGFYSFVSAPETVSISVDMAGYQSTSVTGDVVAGSVITYSPALLAIGQTNPATQVTLRGRAVDAQTNTLLQGASIVVNSGSAQLTDATGNFEITGLPAGALNISVSLAGYQTTQYTSIVESGGILNLGDVYLSSDAIETSSTFMGLVQDSEYLTPVAGATIVINNTPLITASASDGLFQIDNINSTSFTATISAVGFISKTININLSDYGVSRVDVSLQRFTNNEFDISDTHTHATTFEAMTEAEVDAVLSYTGSTSISVRLFLKVVDSNNQLIEYRLAQTVPLGVDPSAAAITLTSTNPVIEQEIEWLTAYHAPGNYQLIVQAFDINTGLLLAERGTVIEIVPTRKIGGAGEFSPPITQLASKTPVEISARVSNQGNLPVPATTLTAEVRINTKGFSNVNDYIEVTSFITEQGLSNPQGMDKDASGNLYVANKDSNTVSVINASGIVSEFATGLSQPVDVDLDNSDSVYVLNQDNSFVVIDSTGVSSQVTTGILGQKAIEVLSDGRILIVVKDGLYEVDLQGAVTPLFSNVGLSNPHGMVMDSQGIIYIANTNENNILQFINGELSLYATGINKPYGIAIDSNNNLIVTSFSDNTLHRVAPDASVTTIASGLSGPFDVKVAPDGNYTVSNNTRGGIVSITPQGVVTNLVVPDVNRPTVAKYATDGSLYIANASSATDITRVSPTGQIERISTVTGSSSTVPSDFVIRDDGVLFTLSRSTIQQILPDGTISVLASTPGFAARIVEKSDGSGLLVTESTTRRVRFFDYDGTSGIYLEPLLSGLRDVFTTSNGDQYLLRNSDVLQLNSAGAMSTVVADNIQNGLQRARSIVVDSNGIIYVSTDTGNRIVKIQNNVVIDEYPLTFEPGALAINANDELFVAEFRGLNIYKQVTGAFNLFATLNNTVSVGLFVDAANNLWASHGSRQSVTRIDANAVQTVFDLSGRILYDIISDGNGGVLVGANGGVMQIDNTDAVSIYKNDLPGDVISLSLAANGELTNYSNNQIVTILDSNKAIVKTLGTPISPTGMCFNNANQLLIAGSNGLFSVTDSGAIPERVYDSAYLNVQCLGNDIVILNNKTAFRRLDLATNIVQDFNTGMTDIRAVAVKNNGQFTVMDYSTNAVVEFDSQFNELSRYIGIVNPRGIVYNQQGELLVANDYPNRVLKVLNNKLQPNATQTNDVQYMSLKADGDILASVVGRSSLTGYYLLDANANNLSRNISSIFAFSGVTSDAAGTTYLLSNSEGALYQAEENTYNLLVSGVVDGRDIESDSIGNIYISDASKGTVSNFVNSNALNLYVSQFPGANRIAFDENDKLFLTYNNRAISSYTSTGLRFDYNVYPVIGGDLSGLLVENDVLTANINDINSIVKIIQPPPASLTQVGDLVYSATVDIPNLSTGSAPVDVQFDNWTPTESGDYLLSIKSSNTATSGEITSALHVGAKADAFISLATTQVVPGDQNVTAYLRVQGADNTTITRVVPDNTSLVVESGGDGFSIAADTKGNVYVRDNTPNVILKITPAGEISTFADLGFNNVAFGLAVDSSDNLYSKGSNNNILKISPEGVVSVFSVLENRSVSVAVDYQDNVYAIDTNWLYSIAQDGTATKLRGVIDARSLTIDAYGSLYMVNGSNEFIRISADFKTASTYFSSEYVFEFEGVNVIADCSNNLLFAPAGLNNGRFAEEASIKQLLGDTGEVRDVLYGPGIHPSLGDIDVLFYDRFSSRLLIWTDRSDGQIFSFPVICGGIDAQVHLITRADVDLSSTNPAPTTIVDNPDGTKEFIWSLAEVDVTGELIELNMLFKNLQEDEIRDALQDAYLTFNNSFDAANPIKLAIDIPALSVSSQLSLVPAVDKTQYGPASDVVITEQLTNASESNFTGVIDLSVVDSNGVVVEQLAELTVNNLASNTTQNLSRVWNTSNILAGSYKLLSVVRNANNLQITSVETPIEIVSSDTLGGGESSVLKASVYADKTLYGSWDDVQISGRVSNVSINAIQLPTTVNLIVSDATTGAPVFNRTYSSRELYPQSYQDFTADFSLNGLAEGSYNISLNALDAATQALLISGSDSFNVVVDNAQSLVATTRVSPGAIISGDALLCESSLLNRTSSDIGNITLYQNIISLSTGQSVDQQQTALTLLAGESFVFSSNFVTATYPAAEYMCILNANFSGTTADLSAAGFQVNESNLVQLSAQITTAGKGRVLVYTDAATPPVIDDPYGPSDAPDLIQQSEYLTAVLKEMGLLYTVVSSSADFVTEMQSGGYSTYILLNELDHISFNDQRQLRDRVFRGAGLIVASGLSEPQQQLNYALGINIYSYWGQVDSLLFKENPTPLSGSYNLAYKENIEQSYVINAQTFAYYPEWIDSVGQRYPFGTDTDTIASSAVAYYPFGLGKSIYVAIDLLAQSTAQSINQSTNLLRQIIEETHNFVTPQPVNQWPGEYVALNNRIVNTQSATASRLLITPPANVNIAAIEALDVVAPNQFAYNFIAPDNSTIDIPLWLQLPITGESVSLPVTVQTGGAGNWVDFITVNVELASAATKTLTEINTQLSQITDQDDYMQVATIHAQNAAVYIDSGDSASGIEALLSANHELKLSIHPLAQDIHVSITHVIARLTYPSP